jgi:guanosine-3',5'-bis(diphosphate) 3'-pyrophosphohydrolase
MKVQKPEHIITQLEIYTSLDSKIFGEASQVFLGYKKRKTFDLRTQNTLKTLLELHADVTTLSAFLLFQIPISKRNGLVTVSQVDELLVSLDGLREITSLENLNKEQSSDSVRKMLMAMSKDLRVVLILMSLRYAELYELDQLSPDLRKHIARQTLDIFVPIAGRLGIYTLKRKMEDRCFYYLSSFDYLAMEESFKKRSELDDQTTKKLVTLVQRYFQDNGMNVKVSGRVKGRYSTYMKLKRRGGGSLDDIFDLLALRVVVSKKTDCYTALSLVNNQWQAITGRFKDYIAVPKVNGYRSLHTTVLGMIDDLPRAVEVQIRTEEMHREAEFGVAAHWWYEERGIKKKGSDEQFVGASDYDDRLKWVKNLVQLQDSLDEGGGPQDLQFFSDRLFVMTLNGRVIELPQGSTPLDFAYALSAPLGHHCAKAKVNGKVVPLDYELKNGDRVFVVQKMDASPNLYWLSLVKTKRAKKAIREWLLEQGEETVLDQGIRLMNNCLRRYQQKNLDKEYQFLARYEGKELTFDQRKNLIIQVGQGGVDSEKIVRSGVSQKQFFEQERVSFETNKDTQKLGIIIAGEKGMMTKLAACCNPHHDQKIVGYVTRGGFISVHFDECKVLVSLDNRRFIEAHWTGQKVLSRDVCVEVIVSLPHLLAKLSSVLRETSAVLISFEHHQDSAVSYRLIFDLRLQGPKDLDEIVKSWQKMDGVESVLCA